jgi:lysophospholipase L1-like esterase
MPLLASLLICEGIARLATLIDSPVAYYLNRWESRALFSVRDGRTGASIDRPNVSYNTFSPDGSMFPVRTDGFGFRNASGYDRQPILAIGDSFTYGDGVADQERWTTRLAQLLGTGIYTTTASLSGPPQQLDLVERAIPQLDPNTRTVLWMVYAGNDIADSHAYDASRPAAPPRASVPAAAIPLLRHSYLARLAYVCARLFNAWRAPNGSGTQAFDVAGTRMGFSFAAAGYGGSDEFRDGLSKLEDALSTFQRRVRDAGTRIVVVYAPAKEEAYRDVLVGIHGVAPDRIVGFSRELRDFGERSGVDVVDLTPAFVEKARSGARLYFSYDAHWNASGNELAALALRDYLRHE